MTEKSQIISAPCNKCHGERNHYVLHEEKQEWHISDQGISGMFASAKERQIADDALAAGLKISGGDVFKMIKCCGCESVRLQHSNWMSESGENIAALSRVDYYPNLDSRQKPTWFVDFSSRIKTAEQLNIAKLMSEVYAALQVNSLRLATMGARAILEHIMLASVGDQGSFGKNLDAFQAHGHLSAKQREIIEPVLEAGHAAIHRDFSPSADDVDTVMTITESLVETAYIQSKMAADLKARVPPRKKRDASK